MLDTVASYDLACIFLIEESNNDVNVLNESSLFTDMLKEEAPNVNFTVNKHEYNQWYYLVNGISPLVTRVCEDYFSPINFEAMDVCCILEGAQSIVKRAIGVLKARFNILASPGLGVKQGSKFRRDKLD